MKQITTLIALSLFAIAVSAQEVTEIKSDTSYLEGREFLKNMNTKTQDRIEAPKPTIDHENSSKEFREYTQRMTIMMKRLNAGQPLPSQEKLDADFADGDARTTDRDFLRKARIDMRLMNERTNPSTPTTKPSSRGSTSASGRR